MLLLMARSPRRPRPLPSIAVIALLMGSLTYLSFSRRGEVWTGAVTTAASSSSASVSSVPGIPPCQILESLFENSDEDPEGKKWYEDFKKNVSTIIEESRNSKNMECTSVTLSNPPALLKSLASSLPSWQVRREELTDADTYDVLLDYLEAFGCSLKSKSVTLPIDYSYASESSSSAKTFFGQLVKYLNWTDVSAQQLVLERETLRRSLTLLMGLNRVKPLDHAFLCLNRASKDLRNGLGLLSEASDCLANRTWDTRQWLRKMQIPSTP